jgi:hypothetical protein
MSPTPSIRGISRAAFLGCLLVGSALIGQASLSYLHAGVGHPFILEKLPLAHPSTYTTALYIHVASACFALPACVLLQLRFVMKRAPSVHRWLGRLTAAVVLGAVVPAGAYLAWWAKGGTWSTLGFWLSGAIVAGCMVAAVVTARRRRFAAHERYTAHVLGQLSVAVTSRTMLVLLYALGVDDRVAYLSALWIPVLASALVVEWFHHPQPRSSRETTTPGRLLFVPSR